MNIQILVDNPSSWIIPYAKKLNDILIQSGHNSQLIHKHEEIRYGDCLFLLSCEKKLGSDLRLLHTYNLVVHESDLPKGRGWSPMTWQVLDGKNTIPITLLEAADGIDSGDIFIRDNFQLQGHELVEELRIAQGEATIDIVLKFITEINYIKAIPQKGEPSSYPRRRPQDSKLDVNKCIKEQFNLLRVCDNERYPAYFELNGQKYIIKITKEEKL